MAIITLTTDFGVEDEYVGVMKGVILSIHPDATIIDITHYILPQDLIEAAYTIKNSYKYFPVGTVHIVVVDPGVGSKRSIIAIQKSGHFFIAPDNGVLSLLFDDGDVESIVQVKNSQYFLKSVSQTFHGRDIFAPVGAHVSLGVRINDLGDTVEKGNVVHLNIKEPIRSANEILGEVVSIDRFGNLITNINSEHIAKAFPVNADTPVEISIREKKITGLSHSYENSGYHEPLAIIGSRGAIEIAVNKGNAQQYFMAEKGDIIKVIIKN